MGFASDIKAFAEKATKDASDSSNKIVRDADTQAVILSPVPPGVGGYSQGHIKDNWVASVDTPNESYSGSQSDTGTSSLASMEMLLSSQPFLGKDSIVYFTNATPWAYRADKIGWLKNDPTNTTGWEWSGRVGAYSFTTNTINYILGKYS